MAMKEVSSLLSWLKKPASESKTVTGPNDLIPSIDLEKQIGEQIYNALQGSVVEEVLRKTKISSQDAYWRSTMEGHSLKVQEELLPEFYALCQEVKQKLKFDEKVDFYITGDSPVNAFSLAAGDEGAKEDAARRQEQNSEAAGKDGAAPEQDGEPQESKSKTSEPDSEGGIRE